MQSRTEGLVGAPLGGGPSEQCSTASLLVGRLAGLLAMHIRSGHLSDPSVFSDLCFSLAKGIDYAVATNEVPPKAQDLPILVKQVYKHQDNSSLQAAVMALMISVKNACMIGWFQNKDAGDLLALAKEIGKTFSNTEDICIEPSYALPSISKIMSRFYPCIKMGHILASLEVKAGYRTVVSDFHILKNMVVPMPKQIGLFVAQRDNMDTSSCIVTPPQANFLFNGKGVQGRNNVSMDTGPQLPTNITAMLKYGINLFQAVGQFNGNYLIVIAFMSMMSSTSETPALQDYVQPVVASLDSNSEIIEGPSRVSLNCPISHKRIKTPVKGHLCKHYQCFDYENFIEMNSRRPSWRCPLCNQSICHLDIRIDQDMAKILGEVAETVVDVIISADGSWVAVLENEDQTDQTGHETKSCQQERPQQCKCDASSSVPAEVVDLTMKGANASDAMCVSECTGKQHFLDDPPCFSVSRNLVQTEVRNSDRVDQNLSTQREENICSRIPSSVSAAPQCPMDGTSLWGGHVTAGISNFSSCNSILSPVLTNAASPVLNESVYVNGTVPLSLLQSQLLGPTYLQSQQFGFGRSNTRNENGMLPSVAINAGRTSTLPQASVSSSFEQRALNSLMLNSTSSANYQSTPFMVSHMNGCHAFHGGMDRGQQLLRPLASSSSLSDMALPSMRDHSLTQNWDVNKHHCISGQAVQQAASFPAQGLGAYHISSRSSSAHKNLLQSRAPHPRITSAMTQPQNIVHPSFHAQPVQFQQGDGSGNGMVNVDITQIHHGTASHPMAQMSRTPSFVPVQLQQSRNDSSLPPSTAGKRLRTTSEWRGSVGETIQPVLPADSSKTLASAQNWQPSGRMRGSLTGLVSSSTNARINLQAQAQYSAGRCN
ncbi:E4 SUMO-protein ligase PIAL1-like isoform X2 [Corylus avellana]|uniref:E4 SUMO-protein ligase PIAL1-like isoform X2 n=1 Tax=Corylus avellana TaxID=13451 RepID=UPI00286C0888|nr:E4 SUMO-protein ligase PIAL1-like isoform X2 [Corylus avellana]